MKTIITKHLYFYTSVVTDTSESEAGVYVMLPGKTQQITHQTGTIVSHRGYPHKKYPNSVDSTLRIEIDGMLLFIVTVMDFQLYPESWDSCSDYLEVMEQRYCGTRLASYRRTAYVSSTSMLNLKFHTGHWYQDEGFLLEYQYYSKFTSQIICLLLSCFFQPYLVKKTKTKTLIYEVFS